MAMDIKDSKQLNYYNIIREAVVKAYPQKCCDFHTAQAKKLYDVVKKEKDNPAKMTAMESELKKLRELTTKNKTQSLMYFIKVNEAASNAKDKTEADPATPANLKSELNEEESTRTTTDKKTSTPAAQPKKNPARAQTEAEEALNNASKTLVDLQRFRNSNDPEVKNAIKVHESAKKLLQHKKNNALRQMKFQQKRRQKLKEMCEENEECRKKLCLREIPGKPNANETQPGLLQAIVDLSMRGAGAHERRRSDALNSCRTLDDLTRELKSLGFNLTRSGIYLRLIPRNWATHEGKRHVTTVNVKLKRAENTEHHHHADTKFARTTHESLVQLCSILGLYDVACLSQDDKAKVPLGLPAANKQSTVIMNMEYEVKLPDHDFVVAARHKLTPSVVAGLEVAAGKFDNAVSYSGPTFIGIRSGKHDSSIAATHAADLRHLYANVEEFKPLLYRKDGLVKPILVIFVDGGPDENPRYQETIKFACSHFMALQLDALFISTQAPGRSAYNPVERRMAPLSRYLAGIILPYDTFGSHLNSQGQTINEEMEKKNFQKAGEILAEVWSEAVIDKFPVVAEWRGGLTLPSAEMPSHEWLATHVRSSQYFLQIVKCSNAECCAPMVSALKSVLPNGFLPAPLSVTNTDGLKIDEVSGTFLPLLQRLSVRLAPVNGFDDLECLPYDFCCPTAKSYITNRTCSICKLYFSSNAMVAEHKRKLHPRIKTSIVPRCRPVRIAARRQRELMAIIAAGRSNTVINCWNFD
jgi:hypothetical protein